MKLSTVAIVAAPLFLSAAVLGYLNRGETSEGIAHTAVFDESAHRLEVQQQVTAQKRATVRTVKRTVTRPDGTREETESTTRTDATIDAATLTTTDATVHATAREETTRPPAAPRPRFRLGAGPVWTAAHLRDAVAVPAVLLRPDAVQVDAGVRVVGPVWLGATVRTDRTVALTVSAEW